MKIKNQHVVGAVVAAASLLACALIVLWAIAKAESDIDSLKENQQGSLMIRNTNFSMASYEKEKENDRYVF